jgi:glucose-1-phosphate adenylyltransferase
VILGGGRGTRLYPLTLERAKPSVSFAGKYRLIDIPISNCINSDIKRVFVCTQFLSESMHRHIMQTYQFDVFSGGFVDILAAEQTPSSERWFQGTADAVRRSLHHLTYYHSDETLILSGDHLYRMDYADLLHYHRRRDADITIGVYPVPRSEASRMGLLNADGDGFISSFVEKPQDPEVIERYRAPVDLFAARGLDISGDQYLASMGIYVFKTQALINALADERKIDFGREIIPDAIGKLKVAAYPFAGYWKDIGTIKSFFDANMELLDPDAPFKLYEPGRPFYTRERSLPPSRAINSTLRDCMVVEGSDIEGADISRSVIGVRSMVREGSHLHEVAMLGADFYENEMLLRSERHRLDELPKLGVGRNCRIERTIIDKNARIGHDVVITPRNIAGDIHRDNYWIRDGICVIPKGAIIPNGTKIE